MRWGVESRKDEIYSKEGARDEVAVTVICMVYNHEKLLEKCLTSLLSQKTSFKYEVIVHDDHSTDRSTERMTLLPKYQGVIFRINDAT